MSDKAEALQRADVDEVADLRAPEESAQFVREDLLGRVDPDDPVLRLFRPQLLRVLQLGVAPNRIDLLRETGLEFDDLWQDRIEGRYGRASASWVDIDGLIAIKKRIDHSRHQDDVRILERVRERRKTPNSPTEWRRGPSGHPAAVEDEAGPGASGDRSAIHAAGTRARS